MDVCMLGWYGSETIGDRAILDGIMKILDRITIIKNIYLGSLLPFYSRRMIIEDSKIYFKNKDIHLHLFCEKDKSELEKSIHSSDLIIMAGGPIIDLEELLIIKTAFKIAKKYKKSTSLIGCGYGPFHYDYYHSLAKSILELSDCVILRDKYSFERAKFDLKDKDRRIYYLQDPAIISVMKYKMDYSKVQRDKTIAINYRNPNVGIISRNVTEINDILYSIIVNACCIYNNVLLVPMHTFYLGGDDRYYYSELMFERNIQNVKILYKPLSLYEIYALYQSAEACIGMRYHSIVLQSILNGKNLLLDYTERNTGKISGFMEELNNQEFYKNRYYSLEDSFEPKKIIDYLYYAKRIDVNFDYNSIICDYIDIIGGIL